MSFYRTGTITIAARIVTGVGTLFAANVKAGDVLVVNGVMAVVETVDTNLQLTLIDSWSGAAVTASADWTIVHSSPLWSSNFDISLTLIEIMERIASGTPFRPDAWVKSVNDRSRYDNKQAGYIVGRTDTPRFSASVKLDDGTWSDWKEIRGLQGVPGPAGPGTEDVLATQSVLNLAMPGDSWFWVNDRTTPNSMSLAAEEALASAFPDTRWNVLNYALGGTCVSKDIPNPGYFPAVESRIEAEIIGRDGISLTIIGTFLNDLSRAKTLGWTAIDTSNEAIAGLSRITGPLSAEGKRFIILTPPPFGGSVIDSTMTQTARATIDAHIKATYPGQYLDAYALLNDGSGNIQGAYQLDPVGDRFHINHAGKVLLMNALVALPYVIATNTMRANAVEASDHIQSTNRLADVTHYNIRVGQNVGARGAVTIRPWYAGAGIVNVQYNFEGNDYRREVTADGHEDTTNVLNGVPALIKRMTRNDYQLFKPLKVASDGLIASLSTSVFGGGVGAALQITGVGSTGVILTGYGNGGSAFCSFTFSGADHTFWVNGTARYVLNTNGIYSFGYGGNTAAGRFYFGSGGSMNLAGDGTGIVVNGAAYFLPGTDNTMQIGGASLRASVIYAATGTINTSDRNEKTALRGLTAAEIAAARELAGKVGIYQWLEAVEKKGADARLHVGLIAQEVEAVLAKHGLDPWSYGFLCKDQITKRVKKIERRTVQAQETVTEQEPEVRIVDGVPTLFFVEKTRSRDAVRMEPVVDEKGRPVLKKDSDAPAAPLLHPVPVMEERDVEIEVDEPAGERLGLRYDQVYGFIIAGLAA